MEENKRKLVVLTANDSEHEVFKTFLSEYFDVKFFKVGSEGDEKPDLIIFTGGDDVNTNLYLEKKGKYTSINPYRDVSEGNVFNRYYGTPKLGICRGAQFLTVMNDGKLIQHVEGHCQNHEIDNIFNQSLKVTSTHHQMMYPFDITNKDSYELIAWAKYFQSDTYLNGNNEETKLSNDFLEPEIVYYKNSNSLCIQGHPEYNYAEQKFKDFSIDLIKKYLFKENISFNKITYKIGPFDKIHENSAIFWNREYEKINKIVTLNMSIDEEDIDFINELKEDKGF